jgi:AcrR family transcriptional regulator
MNLNPDSLKISKPKQARSKKTMENILDTAQQMLIDSTFDKASIQEIVKKANSSVGSFYSLFKTKNNLLECLLDRYQDWLIEIVQEYNKQDIPKDMVSRASLFIKEYISVNQQESGMLRARHIYNITKLKSIPETRLEKNELYQQEVESLFEPCIHEINHPNPKKALTFILILLDIFIGEKIIFEEVTNKNKVALNHQELHDECLRLFLNYLEINYEKE